MPSFFLNSDLILSYCNQSWKEKGLAKTQNASPSVTEIQVLDLLLRLNLCTIKITFYWIVSLIFIFPFQYEVVTTECGYNKLFVQAKKRRVIAQTGFNEFSSRGHALYVIRLSGVNAETKKISSSNNNMGLSFFYCVLDSKKLDI